MPMEDRCCQRSMIQVQHVIGDFSNDQYKTFERLWTRLDLLKKVNDAKVGIQ
jgi:hypothetical protein